jgi:hypothetical protein
MKNENEPWIRRTQFLTQALIISGTLNIALIATFSYFALKDKQKAVTMEMKPVTKLVSANEKATNEALLAAYTTLPFQELLLRLENKELLEDGYTRRDLALACLVAFHHFNLERALGGLVLQKRQLPFTSKDRQEVGAVTIFPGLADYQYSAIIHYAKTEKWPFTSEGLFYELKNNSAPHDPTLLEAFYLTPEFHTIFTLFLRSGLILGKEHVLQMAMEGPWTLLSQFAKKQREGLDLTPDRRRLLLVDYLNCRSRMAARILLETDREFTLKRLDDAQVLLLIDLAFIPSKKDPHLEIFAKELLISPRSDLIWKKAGYLLYAYAGEVAPEPYNQETVLQRFLPERAAPSQKVETPVAVVEKEGVKESPKPAPKEASRVKRVHTVQEGESLWKIAKKYHVSVEQIMRQNHLESEKLRVGKKLDIPDK